MRLGGPIGLPRAAAPPFASRAPGSTPWPGRIPLDPEARSAAEEGGAARRPVSPPPAVAARAPEVRAPRPPTLFVTAPLPVCGRRTGARFPGREAAEGRGFLADSPALLAPPLAPPMPPSLRPESPLTPLLRTRGRCVAAGPSGRGSALRGPGPLGPARRGAAGHKFSFLSFFFFF